MSLYNYTVTVNSRMTNPALDTTMRAELHIRDLLTEESTESGVEERYEGELMSILEEKIRETFKGRIPQNLKITGLAFEEREKVSDVDSRGGKYGFTENQLDTTGEVSIKRVNVNGEYKIRFSDDSGTFKRISWSQKGRSVDEWRTLFREAQNDSDTIPKRDTASLQYVIEPSEENRSTWSESLTWNHRV